MLTAAGRPARQRWTARSGGGGGGLLAALSAYAAVRAAALVALAVWSSAKGTSALVLLSRRWDSLWYVRVVDRGYGYVLVAPDGRRLSDLAFFPLLPWLERSVAWLTGFAAPDAGLLVSAVASLAAAAGIHAVVRRSVPDRPGVAVAAVVLWAALPVGIVQSIPYSESLFTALAAWSLWCALEGRWIAAGLLASAAGLTRPVGLAVAGAVLVAAGAAARRGGVSARLVAGAVLAPAGAAAYVLWVGARRGSLFGYLDVQHGWGNGFDGGAAFARFVWGLAARPPYVAGPLLAAGVAVLLWGYARGFREGGPRLPPPVQVYTGVVLALALCSSGYFGSKPRLLMPAFGVLVPVAAALERLPVRWCAAVLAACGLGAAVYGAFWLNGSGPP
ncbi:hypothetical protein [Streptomyces sp. NPDC020983]|uniref:hypothetical protein n=1 Tax=Streptomyces sp. NPDC020983 TaxID=3365106 RepID=UPI00378D045B